MADPRLKSRWFDAHLDLATLAVEGRDLTTPLAAATGPHPPAAVTLPSLTEAGVAWACATIFTAPERSDVTTPEFGSCGYPRGDAEAAFTAGRRQLEIYHDLERRGLLSLVRTADDLQQLSDGGPIRILILLEGADPIREPDQVRWWHDQGARAVGLSWARGTRYAGGNAQPGPLTAEGRRLIERLDALDFVHDLSHLPDDAAREMLESTNGPVMASHSNCRSLLDGENQRHLPDELIRAIGQRVGMIGLNLYSRFLTREFASRRATISETIDHVERICDLLDRRDLVGLGSDMDGGFGADHLPDGIDRPAQLHRLSEELYRRGWSDGELEGFMSGNWRRFFAFALSRRDLS